MSVFKSIFLFVLTCLTVPPIFAETDIASIEMHRSGFSMGVDDFPWNASEVSLRWWQDNGKGKELALEKFYLTINKRENAIITSEYSRKTIISFPNISYYFLSRSPSRFSENLYLTRGFGFGLGLDISLLETAYSDTDRLSEDRYWGSLSFYLPIGIEHFFWDKFPNLSYSVGFDLYGSISLRYLYYNRIGIRQKSKEVSLIFGISTPKFFIRWCF